MRRVHDQISESKTRHKYHDRDIHENHNMIQESNLRAYGNKVQQDAINRRMFEEERRHQQALNNERRHNAQIVARQQFQMNQLMQRERNMERNMAMALARSRRN
jgi:hypothetical protein